MSDLLPVTLLVELTSPCEENMDEWHGIKLEKCSCLLNKIKEKGWFKLVQARL